MNHPLIHRREPRRSFAGTARRRRVFVGVALVVLVAACGTRVEGSAVASRPGASGGVGAVGVGEFEGAEVEAVFEDSSLSGGAAGGSSTRQKGSTTGGGTKQSGKGASGSTDASSGGDATPIVLGAVGTRSGVVGASQESHWQGVLTWVKWINAQGGLGGREVKFIVADDGGDPGRHARAVRQLIEDEGVVAFVGSPAPITFSAGVPILEEYGIPAMGGDSAEKGWFDSEYAFPWNGGPLPEGRAMGKFIAGTSVSRMAIFYLAEVDFGKIYTDHMKKEWEGAGKEVVLEAPISLGQPDFTAEVLRARGAGADVVMVASEATGIRRFLDSAERQDYRPVFLSPTTGTEPVVTGSPLVGNLYASSRNEPPTTDLPPMRELQDAIARFAPEIKKIPTNLVPGWAAGKLFELVFQESGGKTDPQAIIEALHRLKNVTLGGIWAPIDWPPGAQPEKPCAKIVDYDGNDWVSVTPEFLC